MWRGKMSEKREKLALVQKKNRGKTRETGKRKRGKWCGKKNSQDGNDDASTERKMRGRVINWETRQARGYRGETDE